jgi:hypothetical protein
VGDQLSLPFLIEGSINTPRPMVEGCFLAIRVIENPKLELVTRLRLRTAYWYDKVPGSFRAMLGVMDLSSEFEEVEQVIGSSLLLPAACQSTPINTATPLTKVPPATKIPNSANPSLTENAASPSPAIISLPITPTATSVYSPLPRAFMNLVERETKKLFHASTGGSGNGYLPDDQKIFPRAEWL